MHAAHGSEGKAVVFLRARARPRVLSEPCQSGPQGVEQQPQAPPNMEKGTLRRRSPARRSKGLVDTRTLGAQHARGARVRGKAVVFARAAARPLGSVSIRPAGSRAAAAAPPTKTEDQADRRETPALRRA